ncbi:MAG: diphthamide biosynthesis enzyme Dph2 [Thermoplasmata archaeon]|nr:diphthamide biosynthesis enzyme Dph2 [Thermoplasmata archaeon]
MVNAMKIMDYSMDVQELIQRLKSRGWKRIGIQLPEGLKSHSKVLVDALKSGLNDPGLELIISGSPCYGACDIADAELMEAGAEGMLHFGHSEIPTLAHNYKIPVIFREMRSERDILPVVKKVVESGLLNGIVGLTTTVQYIHHLPRARDYLRKMGVDARIGKGSRRLRYPGQVLGCGFSSAAAVDEADIHLFIGEGLFHPLGIMLATRKKVVAADPVSLKVQDMEKEKDAVLRQRFAAIQRLKASHEIGVILSTLPGQGRSGYARTLVKMGEEHGKKMQMVVVRHLSPLSLRGLGIKALVSTACPRVAIDDYSLFLEHKITLTTPIEFLIALGLMKWRDYVLDSIEE